MNAGVLDLDLCGVSVNMSAYALCLLGGGLAGFWIAARRLSEVGLFSGATLGILLLAGMAGVAGARIAACSGGESQGFSLYGGVLGFLSAISILGRAARFPVLRLLDGTLPCVLLGLSFCRIGCLLAGCCFGIPAERGWRYPTGSPAHAVQVAQGWIDAGASESHPTVPLPLAESAWLLLASIAASIVWRRRGRTGRTAAACGILYAGWRFLTEFLRGDPAGSGSATSQTLSLLVLAGSFALALLPRGRNDLVPSEVPRFSWTQGLNASLGLLGATLVAGLGSLGCHSNSLRGDDKVLWMCGDACLTAVSKLSLRRDADVPAKLQLAVRVGERMTVHVTAEGTFRFEDLPGRNPAAVRGRVASMILESAGRRIEGHGEIDLRVNGDGSILIRDATVGEELLSALKAIEPYTAGALRVKDGPAPLEELARDLRMAVAAGDARASAQGTITIAGTSRPFRAEGRLTPADSGVSRLSGTLRIEAGDGDLVLGADYRADGGALASELHFRWEPEAIPGLHGWGR
jgi:prolipoprotein diacylglyceryltransferase